MLIAAVSEAKIGCVCLRQPLGVHWPDDDTAAIFGVELTPRVTRTLESIDNAGNRAGRQPGGVSEPLRRRFVQFRDQSGAFALRRSHAEPPRSGFVEGDHRRGKVTVQPVEAILDHLQLP